MQHINASMLATHQLPVLFKTKWLEQQIQACQKQIQETEKHAFDESQDFNEDDVLNLCHEGDFISAAHLLVNNVSISRDSYLDYEYELSPLLWAVEQKQLQLMLVLIAMGEDVNRSDSLSFYSPLVLADAMSFVKGFNLLILHPDINVNVEGNPEFDFADIRQFLGEETHDTKLPVLRLCNYEYLPVLKFLSINTEVAYGNEGLTAFVYACKSYDYEKMNQLVLLGADINPEFNSDYGNNLLNWVVGRYLENNFSRLKWFGRFTKILDSDCEDAFDMADFIASLKPEVSRLFGVSSVINFKNERSEEYEELKDDFCMLKSDLDKVFAKYHSSEFNSSLNDLSLMGDLIRTERVRPYHDIADFRVSRRGYEQLEFAVYTTQQTYPKVFSLPIKIISKYFDDDVLFIGTPLQVLYSFVNAPRELFDVLEAAASMSSIRIFDEIDGVGVLSKEIGYFLEELINSNVFCVGDDIQTAFMHLASYQRNALLAMFESGFKMCPLEFETQPKSEISGRVTGKTEIMLSSTPLMGVGTEGREVYLYQRRDDKLTLIFSGEFKKVFSFIEDHFRHGSPLFGYCDVCGDFNLRANLAYGECCNECM